MQLSDYREKFYDWVGELAERERLLVIVGGLMIIYILWDIILYSPLIQSTEALTIEIQNDTQKIDSLRKSISDVVKAGQRAVHEDNKSKSKREQQLSSLQQRVQLLDTSLNFFSTELVSPKQMTEVLTHLLADQPGLNLISVESHPVQPLIEGERGESQGFLVTSILFKRGVTLVFRGSYFATISYLERIEKLPWRFFWDKLDYKVINYPDAEVTLRLHVLSKEKEWIGV